MTEPTQDAPATDAPAQDAPVTDETTAPEPKPELTYPERVGGSADAVSYEVTKPVFTDQLVQEIKDATNATEVLIQMPVGLWDAYDASPEFPLTVWVTGAKSKKSVNDALAAHQADTQFGLTDEQKADAAAIAKVQDPNATVTTEDLTAAIRVLLQPAPQPSEVTA